MVEDSNSDIRWKSFSQIQSRPKRGYSRADILGFASLVEEDQLALAVAGVAGVLTLISVKALAQECIDVRPHDHARNTAIVEPPALKDWGRQSGWGCRA